MDSEMLAASVVVVLPEEIDIANADTVRERLCAAFTPGVRVVIADMTSTGFCDSAGFRALLMSHDHAGSTGAELRLVIRPGAARKVLTMLGLDRLLPVYPSLDAAQARRAEI